MLVISRDYSMFFILDNWKMVQKVQKRRAGKELCTARKTWTFGTSTCMTSTPAAIHCICLHVSCSGLSNHPIDNNNIYFLYSASNYSTQYLCALQCTVVLKIIQPPLLFLMTSIETSCATLIVVLTVCFR